MGEQPVDGPLNSVFVDMPFSTEGADSCLSGWFLRFA